METQLANKQQNPIKVFFEREGVKSKFEELMGKRSTGFITSLLSVVSNNAYLKNASPESVYMAAMMAATLDLPINPNLGFAYIIPYGEQAQFQMGYKGFIQLALRSGQFKTISACPIYEGQLIEENPLTGYVFDFKKKTAETIIGYAAYFSLINGFEKSDFWTVDEIKAHGKKFSKTFSSKAGVWEKDFDAMAMKTVLKLLLSKYAPLSVEMQKAVIADQSIINDSETLDVTYVDEGNDKNEISIDDLRELLEIKRDALSVDELKEASRIVNTNDKNSFKKLQTLLSSK